MPGPYLECKFFMGKDYVFVIFTSQHLAEIALPIAHATSQPPEATEYVKWEVGCHNSKVS